MFNPLRKAMQAVGPQSVVPQPAGTTNPGQGYQAGAAGAKVYNGGGTAPNVGQNGGGVGYAIRDRQAAARRQAIINRAAGLR